MKARVLKEHSDGKLELCLETNSVLLLGYTYNFDAKIQFIFFWDRILKTVFLYEKWTF